MTYTIEQLQTQRQKLVDRDEQAAKECMDLSRKVEEARTLSPLDCDYRPQLLAQWCDAINHWKNTRSAIEMWDATFGPELAQLRDIT